MPVTVVSCARFALTVCVIFSTWANSRRRNSVWSTYGQKLYIICIPLLLVMHCTLKIRVVFISFQFSVWKPRHLNALSIMVASVRLNVGSAFKSHHITIEHSFDSNTSCCLHIHNVFLSHSTSITIVGQN